MASQQARATQQAEQARQLEAQQFWDEAKDTDDPAVLQAVVDRYEGTVYAQLAEVKLQAMQAVRKSRRQVRRTMPRETGCSGSLSRAAPIRLIIALIWTSFLMAHLPQ